MSKSKPKTTAAKKNARELKELESARTLHAISNTLIKLPYATAELRAKPAVTSPVQVFERARYWARESPFLVQYYRLKRAIFNYDPKLVPSGKDAKGSAEKLEMWLDEQATATVEEVLVGTETVGVESNYTNREAIARFMRDAWDSFLVLDNVVAMWIDDRSDGAMILAPEKCTYINRLGVEILQYAHGLSAAEVKALLPEQAARFAKSQITLDSNEGEHFRVLTNNSLIGDGFSVPSLYSVFRALYEVECKDVGFSRTALLMRNVTRFHSVGHEIRNGNHAGKATHFWNKIRDTAIKNAFKDVEGVYDFTTNFDHEIEFPWPDLKRFDETAYKGSDKRLNDWGGPVAKMLAASGLAPYLTSLLKAEALDRRESMSGFLSFIITAAFKPPVPVKVQWSNIIFSESRLMSEMLKFAYQNGLSSAATTRREMGFSDAEPDLKLSELEGEDADKRLTPAWDAAHGTAPAINGTPKPAPPPAPGAAGKPPGEPGKPPGKPDAS